MSKIKSYKAKTPKDHIIKIRDLFLSYQKKNSVTFEDFKKTWDENKMTTIYDYRFKGIKEGEYFQLINTIAIGYLETETATEIRIAVIYTLFLFYQTQPYNPKYSIYVSNKFFLLFIELFQQFISEKFLDAFAIFRLLLKQKIISFVGFQRFIDLPSSHLQTEGKMKRNKNPPFELVPQELFKKTNTDKITGIQEIKQISDKYDYKKKNFLDNLAKFPELKQRNPIDSEDLLVIDPYFVRLDLTLPNFPQKIQSIIQEHNLDENEEMNEKLFNSDSSDSSDSSDL
ncbi:small nuclear RNA activating complex polypeptide 1 [Anaeramoeba ignava]|uniref:Small nuclear RNA activating complex polypeptide 1 n=1 Tax=Anaeramoeba ignava TaxID=1746090 RepID=A0A9Q0LDA6_ANAIG|nr:small nuclear RNA activating complex polypeptide 1 [Anaeramoeba ignava]